MTHSARNDRPGLRILEKVVSMWSDWSLDPEELMEIAVRNQKSEVWGEGDFQSGLREFCRAVNQDSTMNSLARFIMRRITRLRLEDRLRIELYLQENPEILAQPVTTPILITGQPRSGTTLLQRLMALDPQFRVTRTWELFDPVPSPDPGIKNDPRIRGMKWDIRLLRWLVPGFQEAHPVDAEDPEECYFLLERVFNQPVSCIFLDLPGYQEWLMDRELSDCVSDYRYYQKQLQILQWKDLGRRWLLKSPAHLLYLEALVEVFPDIRFIIAQRDPMEMVPSLCSLAARMRSGLYWHDDPKRLGDRILDMLVKAQEQADGIFSRLDEEYFFTYDYSELMKDPVDMVRRI